VDAKVVSSVVHSLFLDDAVLAEAFPPVEEEEEEGATGTLLDVSMASRSFTRRL
jgi:hypothetical protein